MDVLGDKARGDLDGDGIGREGVFEGYFTGCGHIHGAQLGLSDGSSRRLDGSHRRHRQGGRRERRRARYVLGSKPSLHPPSEAAPMSRRGLAHVLWGGFDLLCVV